MRQEALRTLNAELKAGPFSFPFTFTFSVTHNFIDELGSVTPKRESMESTTVMSYNLVSTRLRDDRWIKAMMPQIVNCANENEPDIIGFQSVDSPNGRDDIALFNMQRFLKESLDYNGWVLLQFNDPEDMPHAMFACDEHVHPKQNKCPIGFNSARYEIIAKGTDLVKWTQIFSPMEWGDFHDLHIYFNGTDTSGDGFVDSHPRFDPVVYVNWVVFWDRLRFKRLMVCNTHYKVWEKHNFFESDESEVKWVRYSNYFRRLVFYTSEKVVQFASVHQNHYKVDYVVITGGMAVGLREQDSFSLLKPLLKDYTDTWSSVAHSGGPWARQQLNNGVDHIWANSKLLVKQAFYDWNPLRCGPSIAGDNFPLIAILDYQK